MGAIEMRSTILWALIAAVFFSTTAHAGREQVHVEMVETLEAYAVYKMGRYEEAFQAWLALAKKGNAQGILNVANMYLAGEGVPKNAEKALVWYKKGAEQGDPHCLLNLAKAYETGDGIKADRKTAEQYFEQAAGAGATEAQVRLAKRLLRTGQPDKARRWLERAAGQGEQVAIALLSDLTPSPVAAEASVSSDERRRIKELLDDMNAAANARDADWLTKAVSPTATIRVRLPGQPEFQKLSKDDYRRLWELTFRKTERYRFARNNHRIVSNSGELRLHSQIREYLTSNSKTEELAIDEQLVLSVGASDMPVVNSVTLVVTRNN